MIFILLFAHKKKQKVFIFFAKKRKRKNFVKKIKIKIYLLFKVKKSLTSLKLKKLV